LVAVCLGCFGSGFFLASLLPNLMTVGTATASTDVVVLRPATLTAPGRLSANLYQQTAAEYRACCLQIYHLAEMRLTFLVRNGHPRPLKPAVVMDLDETVLDNSAFQTFLCENQREYSNEVWEVYERDYPGEVALVPGAGQFVRKAAAMGVTVVFMSNRLEENRKSTTAALARLGLSPEELHGELDLRKKGATTDKSARREMIAAKYNVLLYFGDNLRDFSETFVAPKLTPGDSADAYRKAIEARFEQVDAASCHWGIDWFVLPNPVYGEWERLVTHDPMARLRPTRMRLPKKD